MRRLTTKASKIFYTGRTIETKLNPKHLRKLLSSFPFESEIDVINTLGLIISLFFIEEFRGQHPSVSIQGDKQNLGKTTLAEVTTLIFQNQLPGSIALTHEEELKKTASAITKNNKVVLIDNIKKQGNNQNSISSPMLEASITSPTLTFRQLGENKVFKRPNNVLFIFTLNAGSFSHDLSTRSIYISLSQNNADRISPGFCPKTYVQNYRDETLGEIKGFIEEAMPLKAEDNLDGLFFFKFKKWAKLINSILHANDVEGFLSNQEKLRKKYDPLKEAVMEFFRSIKVDQETTKYFELKDIIKELPHEAFPPELTPVGKSMKLSNALRDIEQVDICNEAWSLTQTPNPKAGGKSKKYVLKRLDTGTSELI